MKAVIYCFSGTWVTDPAPSLTPMIHFHNEDDPTIPCQQAKSFAENQGTELITYRSFCGHLDAHLMVEDFEERMSAFVNSVCARGESL